MLRRIQQSVYATVRRVLPIALVAPGACDVAPTENGTPSVSSVSITASAASVEVGSTLQLSATVLPSGASQSVTWSSSNAANATVDGSGLVTALLPGTVRITATSTADATKSANVDLTLTGCVTLTQAMVGNGGNVAAGNCYRVTSALSVNAGTLTIAPGVRIEFTPSGALTIASAGRLNAAGTAQARITFTSVDPVGSWRGIRFVDSQSASNVLRYVSIGNAGSSGWSGAAHSASALLLEGNSVVDMQQSTIAGSKAAGLTMYAGAQMTFSGNVLESNAIAAWVHPNTVRYIASDNVFIGNVANVVRVVFGNNDDVTDTQTWLDVGVPFEIRDRFFIEAPLTLEPGVVVSALKDVQIIVTGGGALTASGNSEAGIRFTSAENLPGFWAGIMIQTAHAGNVFNEVLFENGGSQPWSGDPDSRAMIYMSGNSKAVFSNSAFQGSGHYALWVPRDADISGFSSNVLQFNGRAMIVHPNRAGAIAANNLIADNTENRVRVTFGNNDAVMAAQTWRNFGAPFYITTRTFVRAPLTIEAGTQIEFAQDASLVLADLGALQAIGTPTARISFRGGQDLVGYWKGIDFGTANVLNQLSRVDVSNAGSSSWFGGANSTGALHIGSSGVASLADVTFTRTGGYAAVVQIGGVLSCVNVNHGGFMFFVHTTTGGGAQVVCPN